MTGNKILKEALGPSVGEDGVSFQPQLWVQARILPSGIQIGFRLLAPALPNNLVKVPLSKPGQGCMTPIRALWGHDEHAPLFTNSEEVVAYVERVRNDVAKQLVTHANSFSPKKDTGFRHIDLNI